MLVCRSPRLIRIYSSLSLQYQPTDPVLPNAFAVGTLNYTVTLLSGIPQIQTTTSQPLYYKFQCPPGGTNVYVKVSINGLFSSSSSGSGDTDYTSWDQKDGAGLVMRFIQTDGTVYECVCYGTDSKASSKVRIEVD